MTDAGSDAQPGPEVACIEVPEMMLPITLPVATAADLMSLLAAIVAHAGMIAMFVTGSQRIGAEGFDSEAIGIEIVTMAPALEARNTSRGRGAAADARKVDEQDGDAVPAPLETPAPDSRRTDDAPFAERAPAPADLVVPDWIEHPQPKDAAATEPVIAHAQASGEDPQAKAQLRPSLDVQHSSLADSIPAAELIARQQGGAAARGRETIDVAAAVMAAARAGRRDTYGLAVFDAIRRNPPKLVPQATGEVKVEFRVLAGGSAAAIRIVRSSGNRQLDEAVIEAIRTTRFPIPPAGIASDDLIYDMPFIFR